MADFSHVGCVKNAGNMCKYNDLEGSFDERKLGVNMGLRIFFVGFRCRLFAGSLFRRSKFD